MQAILVTDEQLEIIRVTLGVVAQSYKDDINDYGPAFAEEHHRWSVEAIERAARWVVALGDTTNVIVSFGEGTDIDTRNNAFGHLSVGYFIEVTNTDGRTVEGYCASVSEDDTVVLELADEQGEHLGELAAIPLDDVARILIH